MRMRRLTPDDCVISYGHESGFWSIRSKESDEIIFVGEPLEFSDKRDLMAEVLNIVLEAMNSGYRRGYTDGAAEVRRQVRVTIGVEQPSDLDTFGDADWKHREAAEAQRRQDAVGDGDRD
jgi:hypothetical protein